MRGERALKAILVVLRDLQSNAATGPAGAAFFAVPAVGCDAARDAVQLGCCDPHGPTRTATRQSCGLPVCAVGGNLAVVQEVFADNDAKGTATAAVRRRARAFATGLCGLVRRAKHRLVMCGEAGVETAAPVGARCALWVFSDPAHVDAGHATRDEVLHPDGCWCCGVVLHVDVGRALQLQAVVLVLASLKGAELARRQREACAVVTRNGIRHVPVRVVHLLHSGLVPEECLIVVESLSV